jgi:hypothetical protein
MGDPSLDYWSEVNGVYVPRSILENAAKIGDGERVFILFPKNHLDSILTGSAKSEKQNRFLRLPPRFSGRRN